MNVGDDARAGPELPPQLRAQLQVHFRREKQRDDGCAPEVGFEQVLLQEGDALGAARALGVRPALADAPRIDVHADAARPELPDRGDHDPSVAATQIVEDVFRADLRELQHLGHDAVRRRVVTGVRSAGRRLPLRKCSLEAARCGSDCEGPDEKRQPALRGLHANVVLLLIKKRYPGSTAPEGIS